MAITISPDELAKSAVKYRKELLSMPIINLSDTLRHMTLRTGVQYKETVGQIANAGEIGPYNPNRKGNSTSIKGRSLEVFLGSCIEEFDPNAVVQSIYGSLVLKGEGLKNVPISKAVLGALMKNISLKLNLAVFSAERDNAGTTTQDLFNGFDTIAETEITAGNISTANQNLFEFSEIIDNTNAVEQLKTFYRSAKDELKGQQVKMFIPISILEAYEDDYQNTVGPIVYNKSFEKRLLEGSNGLCELVPLVSKAGSGFIQLSPKSNLIVGTGMGSDIESIEVGKYAPLLVTLTAVLLFGCQYETISPERLLIGKLSD